MFSEDRGSYDIKEYLCRAYIRVGQIQKELGANNRVFEYYEKALLLSNKLVKECECITYLDTLAWSERVMSYFYEDIDDIENAICHREKSLATAEYVIKMNPKREYEEYRYRSLCKLGELYEKTQDYCKVIDVAETALSMEERGFSTNHTLLLSFLVNAYGSLGNNEKKHHYSELLKKEQDEAEMNLKALVEVVEVLSHMSDDELEKIPKEVKDAIYEGASGVQYSFALDTSKPLGEQICREALAILSYLGMQFWTDAFDKSIVESHNSSEDNVRTEMWGKLKKKMHKAKYDATLLQSWLFASHEETFQEAYYMLERLPVRISSMLSIEKLMWVKEKRKTDYYTCSPDIEELSVETLALLKYVLGDLVYLN